MVRLNYKQANNKRQIERGRARWHRGLCDSLDEDKKWDFIDMGNIVGGIVVCLLNYLLGVIILTMP